MRLTSALLASVAAALWLAWATRDYHDNQRNWLLWLAVTTTALSAALGLAALTRRLRGKRPSQK